MSNNKSKPKELAELYFERRRDKIKSDIEYYKGEHEISRFQYYITRAFAEGYRRGKDCVSTEGLLTKDEAVKIAKDILDKAFMEAKANV